MDTNDLQRLASHLEHRGLRVAVNDSALRLDVTNPLNSRLSEEIILKRQRYVTGFDHEIGETGDEATCADRIARILAVARTYSSPSVPSNSPTTDGAGQAEAVE